MQTKENKEPQPSPERETLSPALREQIAELAQKALKPWPAWAGSPPESMVVLREYGESVALIAYAEGQQAGAQEERERILGPGCPCAFGREPWHQRGVCRDGEKVLVSHIATEPPR